MKEIVSVNLGPSSGDYEFTTEFLGQQFRVRRFGADFDERRAEDLVVRWQPEAHVLGLGSVNDHYLVGKRRFQDRTTARLEAAASRGVVTTGARLWTFFDEWAVRHVQREQRNYFNNARVLMLNGATNYQMARTLSEFTRNLMFADPVIQFGIPRILTSLTGLEAWAVGADRLRNWVPTGPLAEGRIRAAWNRHILRKAMQRASVVVAPLWQLEQHTIEELGGKVVLTSSVTDEALAKLRNEGVDVVIDRVPQLLERPVEPDVLDAMILALLDRKPSQVTYDDYLEIFEGLRFEPRVLYPSGKPRRVNRFAFVIHPLSGHQINNVKSLQMVSKVLPERFQSVFEKVVAYSPPFVYTKVTGIRSPLGVEAEGWLITLGGTPKEMLAHRPEFTYRRLLAAAKMAERLGAQVMGLGAFTKVVGDAGVTVAKRAPIPVTTGNSYSASGALWAAHDAARRMGLLSIRPDGKVAGKAMVVGATGAIGSVCARLLAMAFEEVHLVSPEVAKLVAMKETILRETPSVKVHLASRAGDNLRDMDVIVTATSGAGQKVVDILKVKPGAIITDVARPLDLSAEDVARRPDVLVIESGEILLPGEVRMKDIGLPPNVAYACMAETIVLALEGRFESFTVGRNIEWEKVKEIYKLGLKHGMRLAAISGVKGVYTDEDIQRVRELALAARGEEVGAGQVAVGT
jgi:predicted amino acid dehydrogenase